MKTANFEEEEHFSRRGRPEVRRRGLIGGFFSPFGTTPNTY